MLTLVLLLLLNGVFLSNSYLFHKQISHNSFRKYLQNAKRNAIPNTDSSFKEKDFGTTALLRCQSLSKRYRDNPQFNEISLTLNPGKRLGLIGVLFTID
jgi:hypothetical protein